MGFASRLSLKLIQVTNHIRFPHYFDLTLSWFLNAKFMRSAMTVSSCVILFDLTSPIDSHIMNNMVMIRVERIVYSSSQKASVGLGPCT